MLGSSRASRSRPEGAPHAEARESPVAARRPSQGDGEAVGFLAARGARDTARGRRGAGAQPLPGVRAGDAGLDGGPRRLHPAGAARRRDARHERRAGDRVEPSRLQAGRFRLRHARLAGVRAGRTRRDGEPPAAGRDAHAAALGARHHRHHRLLRSARRRQAPARGDGRRVGRRGRDRLRRRADREAEGLPRRRDRGRRGRSVAG